MNPLSRNSRTQSSFVLERGAGGCRSGGIIPVDSHSKELWVREFRLNGFIHFHNFLPVDFVTELQSQVLPLVLGEFTKLQAGDTTHSRAPFRLAFDLSAYADLMHGPLDDDRYRRN